MKLPFSFDHKLKSSILESVLLKKDVYKCRNVYIYFFFKEKKNKIFRL